MKYLIKSNFLVIVSAFAFPFIYFTITFKEYSYTQALMIIIAIFEAILVKSNYDFINYDHDFKYHIHQLPKWLFYMMNILCNLVVIGAIIFLKSNFKYLILISLLFSMVIILSLINLNILCLYLVLASMHLCVL